MNTMSGLDYHIMCDRLALLIGDRRMLQETLKFARNRREWTETYAAQQLGMSQSYLAMLEGGQRKVTPRLARKMNLKKCLNVVSLP